jgi:hypothetical protein
LHNILAAERRFESSITAAACRSLYKCIELIWGG